ncbi:hypothetical protein [Porphyrobacter sp. GA68]|uniref:hypothetical protein n=1 Tax=Porphyrobacter sp. GA68 TaxID=2883480 RepID=UPI001D18AA6C|nr:hypothetical protein [Porphyrobacter sp. GA68]
MTIFRILLLTALTTLPAPTIDAAAAAPGGRLGVLPLGFWQCGVPGDAMGSALIVDDRRSFVTRRNSAYYTREGSGTYLLTGTTVTFTRGPLKGLSLQREDRNRLRLVVAAAETNEQLVCNRRAYRIDSAVNAGSEAERD